MKFFKTLRENLQLLQELYARFGDLVRNERRLLFLASLAMGAEIFFQVMVPFPMRYILDGLLMPTEKPMFLVPQGFPDLNDTQQVWIFVGVVCLAAILIAVGLGVSMYYRRVWAATAGQRMVMKLRKRLYDHLHRLPLSFHHGSRLGDLLMRITGDIGLLRSILSESLIELIGRVVQVGVFLTLLFIYDAPLALVSVAVIIFVTFLSRFFGRRILKVARKQREQEGILAYTAGETLAAVALVKAYGREEQIVHSFARQNRTSMRKGLKGVRLQAGLSRWVELAFGIGLAVVLGFGALRVLSGDLTVGFLVVFVSWVRSLNKPLRKVSRISARIGKAAACGERILEILNIPVEEIEAADGVEAPPLKGEIQLAGVNFSYSNEVPVLENVDLHIAPGERVGIVGRNGAGKSTLMYLLLRFFEPTSGTLFLDGVDASTYTLKSVRNQMAVALQDTFLFGWSIRDNLLFAAPNASEEQMFKALEVAGADFIHRLPEGLDTELQEGGSNLSGGERRKLSLAGTLLHESPILILDEPTTYIDRASRDDILGRLPEFCRGRTTVMITHDPQVLPSLDRVVYLEEGRVAAEGSHSHLQKSSTGYQALFPSGSSNETNP
ncbi:MAG: ABC transporter ATP-binding protein [Planctomycetota bacterium]